MNRPLAAAAAFAVLAIAGAASAQTAPSWGQPVYLGDWGRPIGGTPLSEVETRSYVETGRFADGYGPRPHVYVPGRAPAYGYGRYRGYGYGQGGYAPRPYQGYRDEWGYNDDRARPGRQGYVDSRRYRHDDGPDVYFYDR
ncbi:MAG: hypothetical protein EON85_05870 [Brevundimonas sp.]|nr:MAG: hypothetical protein EON85_05870 [Brevundimonas sp.]